MFRFEPSTFDLGLTHVEAAPGEPVRIYDPTRTVVDLMRADKFVIKGGMLLAAYDARRPTADLDALARSVINDREAIVSVVSHTPASPSSTSPPAPPSSPPSTTPAGSCGTTHPSNFSPPAPHPPPRQLTTHQLRLLTAGNRRMNAPAARRELALAAAYPHLIELHQRPHQAAQNEPTPNRHNGRIKWHNPRPERANEPPTVLIDCHPTRPAQVRAPQQADLSVTGQQIAESEWLLKLM